MKDIDLTMNDIELIDEIVRRADEHQKQKERDFAISELEGIKAEFLNLSFTGYADKPKLDRSKVLNILDNHISELKGDNNEEV